MNCSPGDCPVQICACKAQAFGGSSYGQMEGDLWHGAIRVLHELCYVISGTASGTRELTDALLNVSNGLLLYSCGGEDWKHLLSYLMTIFCWWQTWLIRCRSLWFWCCRELRLYCTHFIFRLLAPGMGIVFFFFLFSFDFSFFSFGTPPPHPPPSPLK